MCDVFSENTINFLIIRHYFKIKIDKKKFSKFVLIFSRKSPTVI